MGLGISVDKLERLFDRFFRMNFPHRHFHGVIGTGLGLSICKAIIEAHGGTIEVASQEGSGGTFRVALNLE